MITIQGEIPREVTIACSGGCDSMAALDFLRRKHQVRAAFFHHGTPEDGQAFKVLSQFCLENEINLIKHRLPDPEKPAGLSLEEWWRNERYQWLDSLGVPVVLGHSLEDVTETWLWSAFNGSPKIIPYHRNLCFRPFMLNKKEEFRAWNENHKVAWFEDPMNEHLGFTRNRIRH